MQFIKDEFKRLQEKLCCKQKEVAQVETELHNLHCHPELAIKDKICELIRDIEREAERVGNHKNYSCYPSLSSYQKQITQAKLKIDSLLDDLITYLRKSK